MNWFMQILILWLQDAKYFNLNVLRVKLVFHK